MTDHSVGLRISYDHTMMYTRCIISFMMQAPMTQKSARCASKIFAAMAVRFSVASSHRLKCATARGSDLQSYETRLPHTHAFDIWRRVSVLVLVTRTRKVPSKIGRYAHSRMLLRMRKSFSSQKGLDGVASASCCHRMYKNSRCWKVVCKQDAPSACFPANQRLYVACQLEETSFSFSAITERSRQHQRIILTCSDLSTESKPEGQLIIPAHARRSSGPLWT
jgi:hypothetical protein